jgi:hypothetical protein
MVTGFGSWRVSSMRIDLVAPVIEPPIGTTSAPLKDEAVRIVITNSVFPEKKSSYASCTPIIGDYSAPPTLCRTGQLLTRSQNLGRTNGLGFNRVRRR